LFYTYHLAPGIDFKTLTIMRSSQAIAIAFLFVPITTLAYLMLKASENAALFATLRLRNEKQSPPPSSMRSCFPHQPGHVRVGDV
jgi:hypothetical protein